MRTNRSSQERQDIAQVCRSGHLINGRSTQHPEKNRAYCPHCGAPTLTACPNCQGEIPGGWINSVITSQPKVPQYCVHCGYALPWTQDALDQANQLFDAIDELTSEQRQVLKECLPDLLRDAPATPLAAVKTGKLLSRVEPHFREAFKQIAYTLIAAKTQEILKGFGF